MIKTVKGQPITASRTAMRPSRSTNANDYTRQGEQFVRQSPEPFRNSQPSANPLSNPRVTMDGSTLTSKPGAARWPGSAPTRSPGRSVMSTQQMMSATGHAPNYRPTGYTSLTSGFPTKGNKPLFKTNNDLFDAGTMAKFKRFK